MSKDETTISEEGERLLGMTVVHVPIPPMRYAIRTSHADPWDSEKVLQYWDGRQYVDVETVDERE